MKSIVSPFSTGTVIGVCVGTSLLVWLGTPMGYLALVPLFCGTKRSHQRQLFLLALTALLAAALAASQLSGSSGSLFASASAFLASAICIGIAIDRSPNPSNRRIPKSPTADGEVEKIGEFPELVGSSASAADAVISAAIIAGNLTPTAWALDAAGRWIYLSAAASDAFGQSVDQLNASVNLGHTAWHLLLDEPEYGPIAASWSNSLRSGAPFNAVFRIKRQSGGTLARITAHPVRGEQGKILGWYGVSTDIEAQQRTLEALRAREKELSLLVHMGPALLWRLSPQGESNFFNARLIEFVGLDPATMHEPGVKGLVEIIDIIVHPDDRSALIESLRNSLSTGELFSRQFRLRRIDGVYRWMSASAEPMRDHAGHIVQWYGMCNDIDDQLSAKEALRQSEQQLQQLIDTVPAMIWSMAPTGQPTYLNQHFVESTGATLADVRGGDGAPTLSLVHQDDREDAGIALREALRTGLPLRSRVRQRRQDGSYRWIETRAQPLYDEAGMILQWYGVNADIDDMVRAQEGLKETERALRQLVETLPALIFCSTAEGKPIYRSERLREFLGFDVPETVDESPKPLLGTLDMIIHPDDLSAVRERYGQSLASGEPYAFRHRLRRHDGVYRWVETRAAAMRSDGQIVQWNGVCIDIDDGVRAQQELRVAQENLARVNQAASLAELSASIAHEIGQPLAALISSSDACLRWLTVTPPNVDRAKLSLDRVIVSARSATDIVGRIRALFSMSVETRAQTSIAGIVSEVVDLLAEERHRKNVQLRVDIEEALPSIAVDPVQIQQVFMNLIRNAMDAMEVQDSSRCLTVKLKRSEEFIEAMVLDNGPGVEFPDQVLEPFYTTKKEGMGMGLAICRTIVEAHGGQIRVQSNKDGGAAFSFTMPI